jgi:hypothetical protein
VKDFLKNLKLNENTISNVLTVLVFVLVGVLIYNYFRSVNQVNREQTSSTTTEMEEQQKAQMTVPEVVSQGLPAEYTVIKGDNLWNISQSICGDGFLYSRIAVDNNLANPRIIIPGQKLTIVCKL